MTDIQVFYEGPIVKRAEAKEQGLKRYFTGKPCKHGHIDRRWTSSGVCLSCDRVMSRDWARANPQKVYEKNKRRRPSITEYQREYRKENRDHVNKNQRMYRRNNKERVLAYAANRRSRILGSGGIWSEFDIKHMLVDQDGWCAEPTCRADLGETGYHVDHIMPLSLGGSNWPDNLQCLCPSCNLRKGSLHPDEWGKVNGR